MKNAILIGLLLILALILGFSGAEIVTRNIDTSPKGSFSGGLIRRDLGSYGQTAIYKMNVNFDPSSKYITVKENIFWRNLTEFPTKELQFHLYANAFKNNKTILAEAYPLNEESQTEFEIQSLTVDGNSARLRFFQPDIDNHEDSTSAKIILDRELKPSDSVNVRIEYKLKIPRYIKRLGYATGRNFFILANWFPKLGVFEDGKWTCSQYHPYTGFFSDFADYDITINSPKDYIIGASGWQASKEEKEEKTSYRFIQKGIHDFAWFASDRISYNSKLYTRGDGSQVLIKAYVQPEKEKYTERYINAVANSLEFFEKNIGIYPYQSITLVDVPRTCPSGGNSYPAFFLVNSELFSPMDTHQPEGVTIQGVAHQFFYGIVASNGVYESWLDEGFSTYLTEKILYQYYDREMVFFKLAGYIPLNGMNLHSLSQIPVVYSVTSIKSDEGANSLENYYKNTTIGAIADTSFKLPDRTSFLVNAIHKPALVLLSMDGYLGSGKMLRILKEYYNEFRFKHVTRRDFYSVVQRFSGGDMGWFFKNFIDNPYTFDYKVNSITKNGAGEFEVLVERAGDGAARTEIAFYTEKDTIRKYWDGKDRWKIFTFKTSNEVIGAEVDPFRKNLLDLNYANNSLTTKPRYGAAVSLAMRWFFWVQYALMTLGGIG